MAKTANINKWLVAGAVGALGWLCVRKWNKSVNGIGNVVRNKKNVEARREFAYNYLLTGATKVNPQYIDQIIDEFANGRLKAMANGAVKFGGKRIVSRAFNRLVREMEQAYAAQFIDYGVWDRFGNRIEGIGDLSVPRSILENVARLFAKYDEAREIQELTDLGCDVVYAELQEKGINPYDEKNWDIVNKALYEAGFTDENGNNDVWINRIEAKRELFAYIVDNILPLFPLKRSDIDLMRNTRSVVYQDKLIDLTRKYLKL